MNVVQARPAKLGRGYVGEAPKGPVVEFYDEIPNHELSLDDFEVFALARLKVRPLHNAFLTRPNTMYLHK